MQHEDRQTVRPLKDLDDYEVADNNPDVRGWDVFAGDGRRIGEVDELLVDPAARKVRYLDIELDEELHGSDRERHILIPVGHARLDDDDDRVVVNSLRAEQAREIPPYSGRLERQYEDSLRSHFGSGAATAGTGQDYYAGEHYDDARLYGTRRRHPGEDPGRTATGDRDTR